MRRLNKLLKKEKSKNTEDDVTVATNGTSSVTGTKLFRIKIPDGIRSGEQFQVCLADDRMVRVRCPVNGRPGQIMSINVPDGMGTRNNEENGTEAMGSNNNSNSSRMEQDTPGVVACGPEIREGQQPYNVPIPAGVRGGQQFPVQIKGHQLMITCPANAREGMSVRILGPSSSTDSTRRLDVGNRRQNLRLNRSERSQFQTFEVVVPRGVERGNPFALIAGGQRVLVTCPANANYGQRIRFQLPVSLLAKKSNLGSGKKSKLPTQLQYNKDGWARTIRVADMKFQWIRMDSSGDVDLNKRFDPKISAYVRKIVYEKASKDPRFRSGQLFMVPANEAVVESRILGADRSELVSYADIASAQNKEFDEKAVWFFETCQNLCQDWNEGHMRINIRRDFLLDDSMHAVMSLSRKDLRKTWRFEFIGEAGIDAGGLAREWFNLVSSELFNPERGLWISSATNQMCMQINPYSEMTNPDDHLLYFRFIGRILGKALFDQHLITQHMVRHMYKHLLGWPVMFDDLGLLDEEVCNNLKKLWSLTDEELEYMYLDFTANENVFGEVKEYELIDDGANIDVNKENLPEYMEASLKFRLIGHVKPQLTELLLGFFDVIPEPLLTVFDFQELELLMCGLPKIDLEDWQNNTEYTGEFTSKKHRHLIVTWFWDVVSKEYDQEFKARLLQFVTGTSGVPSRGFSVLQGSDGHIRKFTIHGIPLAMCLYPRAHTCFNRIDLPIYETREQLEHNLTLAVQLEATGFGIE